MKKLKKFLVIMLSLIVFTSCESEKRGKEKNYLSSDNVDTKGKDETISTDTTVKVLDNRGYKVDVDTRKVILDGLLLKESLIDMIDKAEFLGHEHVVDTIFLEGEIHDTVDYYSSSYRYKGKEYNITTSTDDGFIISTIVNDKLTEAIICDYLWFRETSSVDGEYPIKGTWTMNENQILVSRLYISDGQGTILNKERAVANLERNISLWKNLLQ